jgi:hypothetical protein
MSEEVGFGMGLINFFVPPVQWPVATKKMMKSSFSTGAVAFNTGQECDDKQIFGRPTNISGGPRVIHMAAASALSHKEIRQFHRADIASTPAIFESRVGPCKRTASAEQWSKFPLLPKSE